MLFCVMRRGEYDGVGKSHVVVSSETVFFVETSSLHRATDVHLLEAFASPLSGTYSCTIQHPTLLLASCQFQLPKHVPRRLPLSRCNENGRRGAQILPNLQPQNNVQLPVDMCQPNKHSSRTDGLADKKNVLSAWRFYSPPDGKPTPHSVKSPFPLASSPFSTLPFIFSTFAPEND